MQENFLKENHKEFFKAEIRRVCVEAKKKLKAETLTWKK